MILGLGIDLVEISRIEKAMQNPRFLPRILTLQERATGQSSAFVAGRWAAKEAVAKAAGQSLSWHDVEILNADSGQPLTTVKGSGDSWIVSISHERNHAIAVAIRSSPQ